MSRWTFKKWVFWITLLGIMLAGIGVAAVSLGAVRISPVKTWAILLGSALGWAPGKGVSDVELSIIMNLRGPRVLSAMLVGAALSTSGAVLQALLRNPLADPFVLGISSGAAFGAVLAILFGLGSSLLGAVAVPGLAFTGALATLLVVYFLARVQGRVLVDTMLLGGVIVSAFFSAVIMFLIAITGDERLYNVTFWLMGNLEYMASKKLWVIFPLLILGCAVLFSLAKDLNLFSLGEETASQLGVEVEGVKKTAFIFTSLVTGAVVSFSGLIGFVGLIVPHLVRLIWGPDHRFLLPACAVVGAILLVLADTVARLVIAPAEIPVGVVTALSGAPFFIYLLRRKGIARSH